MNQSYKKWRQKDPQINREEAWPASQFPDADYHYFRDCGCLVCALAVMLRHYDIEKEEDENLFDPWILNKRLIDCGAFSSAADLELSAVNNLYPLEYLGTVPYSRTALVQIVKSGLPCLITVPGVNADRHFTVLCELLQDDAIVFDPICGEKRLSAYDRICEIRVFRPLMSRHSSSDKNNPNNILKNNKFRINFLKISIIPAFCWTFVGHSMIS